MENIKQRKLNRHCGLDAITYSRIPNISYIKYLLIIVQNNYLHSNIKKVSFHRKTEYH
jgi:hypothetical protein